MSTNNNRLGKEVQADWKDEESKTCQIKKFSADKLARLTTSGSVGNVTALSLSGRGIGSIDETSGLAALRRLDLSKNKLKRLAHMANLSSLGMLNISCNEFSGGDSLEELRYLPELRTLNIGENPSLGRIKKHTLRALPNLQAFIAHECGLSSTDFLRKASPLTTIILSKNQLDSFPSLESDNSFYNLVKLNIGHNKFTTFPDLSFCPSLEELKINNNMIGNIPSSLLENKKLKTLSVASNQISSWASLELLTGLPNLTNLSAKGNPLPEPPAETSGFILREDLSAEKLSFTDTELKYRRHLLGLFQIQVGKELKLKVRLIVLDMHRVKAKWSHEMIAPAAGGADKKSGTRAAVSSCAPVEVSREDGGVSEKKTRRKRPRGESPPAHRGTGQAQAQQEAEPAAPPAKAVADGEVLGGKKQKVVKEKASSREPTRASSAPSMEAVQESRPDRGAESGVVSVKESKKKKPSSAEVAPDVSDEKHKSKKGKSGAKATSADPLRSVDDILFGGGSAGGAAVASGWD
jgi:hypothetical protein